MPNKRAAGGPAGRPATRGKPLANAAAPGQIRIIGGALRRSLLPVVAVEGLRPTPDRVRETLFNWLGQSLPPIAVLDAFAGTGALGLEALSRGAVRVDFFETHPQVRQSLVQTVGLLAGRLGESTDVKATVSGDNVCSHLQNLCASSSGFRYDLALLDPPFQSEWLLRALPLTLACMQAQGRVYVEWHARLQDEAGLAQVLQDANWCVEREQRAGQVFYHLLSKAP